MSTGSDGDERFGGLATDVVLWVPDGVRLWVVTGADRTGPGRTVESTVPLAVELKNVRKHFGDVQAVRDVDVNIAPGEIVAMLGPNGAGKTSTIDIILGLSRQTSGRALC